MTVDEPADPRTSTIDEGERAELAWLRAENALLRTERDVLVRVATEFAEDAHATILHRTARDIRTRGPQLATTRGMTMSSTDTRVWLTGAAHDRLRGELEELRAKRFGDGESPEIDDHLGDRHDKVRIRRIEDVLHNAVVGSAPPDDGVAEPGMVLTVRFDGDPGTEEFLLGLRDGEVLDGVEVYSPESPLGRALIGAREGEQREYTVPSGATVAVELVHARPYRPLD